jgi:hypothetical protein
VIKELKKFDLSNDSLGINEVLEGLWDLLDGNLCLALVIICAAHNAISSVPDLLDVLEFVIHYEGGTYNKIKIRGISYQRRRKRSFP